MNALLLLSLLGPSPVIVPPPQNLVSSEVKLTEGFEATGDYDTVCSSASARYDYDGVQACPPLTDVAAAAMNISAQSAAPLGSGSTTGASVVIRPGSGTHKAVMTAASFVNNTTTFTVTIDGTANTGTEGTAFECDSVTDTVCANNIANWIEALAGAVGVHACSSGSTTTCTTFGFTGVAGTAYFWPAPEDSPAKYIDSIACSTGAAASLTNGTNGSTTFNGTRLSGGVSTAPALINQAVSTTVPSILHSKAATTYGIGGSATATNLIANSASVFSCVSGECSTNIAAGVLRVVKDGYLTIGGVTGSSAAGNVVFNVDSTFDQFTIMPNAAADNNNQMILGALACLGQDFDHAAPTDPTFYAHSLTCPDTNNTQWMSVTHDQTNGVLDVGTGVVSIPDGVTTAGTMVSTRATDIGWSVVNAANQACNTTCTNACVVGLDTAAVGSFLLCTDATADTCLCAGAN